MSISIVKENKMKEETRAAERTEEEIGAICPDCGRSIDPSIGEYVAVYVDRFGCLPESAK